MEAVAKIHHRHQPLEISLHRPHNHRPSFSTPISSLPFGRTPPPPRSLKLSLSIRAKSSSFSDPQFPNLSKTPKPQLSEALNPSPLSLLKPIAVAAVAAAAVFSARFNPKPLVATAISPPPAVKTASKEAVLGDDEEKALVEHLGSNPDDVEALQKLMEVKVKKGKVDEAIAVVEELIKVDPTDIEWSLLKGHLYLSNEQVEMAKKVFDEILEKFPARVAAYHGLVMAASEGDSGSELKEVQKRVEEAIILCKKEKKKDDLRDFKLLIAQIRVIEGDYDGALKAYQELVKEEPMDFRPYLCQGIVYTLLEKKEEAEKQFERYRRLVPKGHPYAQYFNDNMIATKLMGQMVEKERAKSES